MSCRKNETASGCNHLYQCQTRNALAVQHYTEDLPNHLFSHQSLIVCHINQLIAWASPIAEKSQLCTLWQPYAISPFGEILCHVNSNASTFEACRELYDGGIPHHILGSQHLYPEIVAVELCCPRIALSATRIG